MMIERFCCIKLFLGEVLERSYFGNLTAIQLNGYYAAAQFNGNIELHLVCASMYLLLHGCSARKSTASRYGLNPYDL